MGLRGGAAGLGAWRCIRGLEGGEVCRLPESTEPQAVVLDIANGVCFPVALPDGPTSAALSAAVAAYRAQQLSPQDL